MAQASGLASKGITLKYKTTSSASTYDGEILGLYEIPALGSTPEQIDVTSLASETKIYVPGLMDPGDCEFSFWYMPADGTTDSNFEVAKNLEDGEIHKFQIEFPDAGTGTGAHGTQCEFQGIVTVFTDSVGVNAAIPFKVSVSLSDLYDGTTVTEHKTFKWTHAV